jgi:hypothetical protein
MDVSRQRGDRSLPKSRQPLDLAELVDLECRLIADREEDPRTLRERDAAIAQRIDAAGNDVAVTEDRHELFRRWLAALRSGDGPTPGERVQSIYRLLSVGLSVGAVLGGVSTAAAVLHYDGVVPVNIMNFLAVFVGLQSLLTLFAIALMLPGRLLGRLGGFGPVQELLRGLGYRGSGRSTGSAMDRGMRAIGGSSRTAAALGRLRSWTTLYANVERWMLVALTRRVALLFNVGALLTCLYLITVTDLAFAWSTTLSVDPARVAEFFRTIALPWRWLLPAAVPTRELVEASHYFRQTGHYDPAMLKDWWAFLVASLCCYGLLPRLLLWGFARRRYHTVRASLALDHGECAVVYERLTTAHAGWSSDHAVDADGTVIDGDGASRPATELPPPGGETACVVLCWADVPASQHELAELAERRFGWRAQQVVAVGGKDDAGRESALAAASTAGTGVPVLVVAEAWEAPGRSIEHMLGELRARIETRRPIIVGLVGAKNEGTDGGSWRTPDDDDRRLWERRLRALGDAYLRVEDMVEP